MEDAKEELRGLMRENPACGAAGDPDDFFHSTSRTPLQHTNVSQDCRHDWRGRPRWPYDQPVAVRGRNRAS